MVKIQLEPHPSTHLSTSHIYAGSLEVLLAAATLANCQSVRCWHQRSVDRLTPTWLHGLCKGRGQGPEGRGLISGNGDGLQDWRSAIATHTFATADYDGGMWMGQITWCRRCSQLAAMIQLAQCAGQAIERDGWINRPWTIKIWGPGAVAQPAPCHRCDGPTDSLLCFLCYHF